MNAVGAVSYGLAALAFLVLTMLMIVSWRGQRQGAFLIAASAVTAGWACLLALEAAAGTAPLIPLYMAETLRNGAWLFALCSMAGDSAPRMLGYVARGAPVLLLILIGVLQVLALGGIHIVDPTLMLSRAGLLTALIGLILLEQIYRNSTESARASLKYLICGVAGLFAYDLFMYSQAEVMRSITIDVWNARGVLNAIAVPLIAVTVRRSPQWSLVMFVSRQAVFYTTTFMGVGAYLLLVAVGGYYVREFGGSWGRLGQIMFFSGSLLLLAFLLASPNLRRHARVFISKHFYRNKYDYRAEWLRFIGTLSSSQDEGVHSTATRAIAQVFSSPGGILFTFDAPERRFRPVAAWPMRLGALPGVDNVAVEAELPCFLARTQWIIDLRELQRTPDIYGNLVLPEWLRTMEHVRMISPLLQLEQLVGFVLLYDPPSPFELTYEDRDLLKTLGRHIATHLAQHEANQRLAEVSQFEAYNRLTAFLMHDLKNAVAQLQLIVSNADRHRHNPQFFDDAIQTIANAVDRMTRLIEQLRADSVPAPDAQADLARLAANAVAHCSGRAPVPVMSARQASMIRANPERLTAVIEHLIRNAQDACSERDSVVVDVRSSQAQAVLTVTDTGSGMEPEFIRERLFRPFDSTKGSKGMGIGAYQVREYVRTLGGRVEVRSSPGAGTKFSVTLPLIHSASGVDVASNAERVVS